MYGVCYGQMRRGGHAQVRWRWWEDYLHRSPKLGDHVARGKMTFRDRLPGCAEL